MTELGRESREPRSSDGAGSIVAVASLLLRNRGLIIGIPILCLALFAVRELVRGPVYSARARFTPDASGGDISKLSGLASQLGYNIPQGKGESLDLYGELLRSTDLLRDAVTSMYPVPAGTSGVSGRTASLVDIFRTKGGTQAEREWRAIDRLRSRLNVTTDAKSNLVTVAVAMPDPNLAVAVDRKILGLVSDFNLRKRQTRAAAEREFTEARMREAQRELLNAENALASFLEANRSYDAPTLTASQERYQRQVAFRQQIYTTLAEAYEQARVDEVRNTPLITLVDRPEGSARRSDKPLVSALLMLIPAFALAIAVAFAREHLRRERRQLPEAYAEFIELRRRALPRFGATRGEVPRRTDGDGANQQGHG